MFDTEKVRRMTGELEAFAREHEDIYLFSESLTPEIFALFRRMKITVRALLVNSPTDRKEIFGCPIMVLSDVIKNFTARTGIIFLTRKPRTNLSGGNWGGVSFAVGNGQLTVPTFFLTADEVLAIYDRLTLIRILQQYQEDGLPNPTLQNFATRFSRGLTTFLDSRFQNFKYQLWDSRDYFKPTYTFDDTAIVIQGPIVYDNNYTAETFKLYRSIYPNVPIVISTWQGEATDDFRRECRENSVILLENAPPEVAGAWNINMQLKSSFCGVKYVQENTSAKFVLKTRTDQRINRFDFLVYFKNLLETFPPKGNKLQHRIIMIESNATKTMPFFFSDFLSFGHVLDISRMYGIPLHQDPGDMTYTGRHVQRWLKLQAHLSNPLRSLDYDKVTKQSHKLFKYNKMLSRFCNPEIYITRTFYKKYIAPIDESKLLETSWKFIRDYVILVDSNSLLFDWCKYEHSRYKIDESTKLAFSRWLDMYRNFKIDWV